MTTTNTAEGNEAINAFHWDRDLSLAGGTNRRRPSPDHVGASAHYGRPWGKAYGFKPEGADVCANEEDDLLHFRGKYEGDRVGVFDKLLVSCFYDRENP